MKLTSLLHQIPRFRMCEALHLQLIYPFMAWLLGTGATLLLVFTKL